MILAQGTLLPDSQLSQVLSGLEGEIDRTRASQALSAEVVIQTCARLLDRLDRGELDKIVQRAQKDLSDDDDDRSSRRDYDRDDRKIKDRDYDRNYDRSYDHGYDRDYDRNYRQKPKKRKSAMLGDLLEIFGGED